MNGSERLAQLVRQRGRQFAHRGDARNARQFRLLPGQLRCLLAAFGPANQQADNQW
jgi:hypothetical protein